MKWFQFILSHSIFISLCAAALCYQTFLLLHIPANYFIYGVVFFATLSSYNFYWLISKYHFNRDQTIKEFLVRNSTNSLLFIGAGAGLLYCLFYLPGIFPEIIIAGGLTILYSVPLWPLKQLNFTRKAGFLKTILLAFTWTYVTVLIPVQMAEMTDRVAITLLFSTRFLFMLMLCIIFDSRDIRVDRIHSFSSLATDVSRHSLKIIMSIVFSLYVLCGFFLRYYFDTLAQVVAFLITGLVTLYVYRRSLKPQGYYFYYFLVDGLMLFSAIAAFVASI